MSEPEKTAGIGPQACDGRGGPRSRSLRQSCAGLRDTKTAAGRPGSRGYRRALTVDLVITWIDGEAADALRVAQARALRKVLTAIAAQRAPEDNK